MLSSTRSTPFSNYYTLAAFFEEAYLHPLVCTKSHPAILFTSHPELESTTALTKIETVRALPLFCLGHCSFAIYLAFTTLLGHSDTIK